MLLNGSNSTSCLSPPAHSLPPAPVTVPINYMGHALDLQVPAIALSASLAYFARLGAFPLESPQYILPSREQSQMDGMTAEDIEDYNRSFCTRPVPRGPGSPSTVGSSLSTRHDWDWLRAVATDPILSGSLPRYTPGILTGKWRGTTLVRLLRVSMLRPGFSYPPAALLMPMRLA